VDKLDIEALFEQYGLLLLFVGLLLEFIALPFPGEITMLYVGYLSYSGIINGWLALVLAFTGTTIGMTITFFLGKKVGMPIIVKYGKWVLLSPSKFEKTRVWFQRYGNFLVFIGYFIPGVRHVTGYFTGILGTSFKTFALYAYSGALFWCICFIGLGHAFGPQWRVLFKTFENYAIKIIIVALPIIFIIWLIRWCVYKQRQRASK